jgi:hypothetical protein
MVAVDAVYFRKEKAGCLFPGREFFGAIFPGTKIAHHKGEICSRGGNIFGRLPESVVFSGFEFLGVADDGERKSLGVCGVKQKKD